MKPEQLRRLRVPEPCSPKVAANISDKKKGRSARLQPVFLFINGRRERIRTFDPLHPMQVRYQAAPHADKPQIIGCKKRVFWKQH